MAGKCGCMFLRNMYIVSVDDVTDYIYLGHYWNLVRPISSSTYLV